MPGLLEHMDAHQEQEEERKFKCDQCGRGYRHAGSLTNHKKTHEVGSFQCSICGKENWNASALKSHLRSHTSFKKYSCAECGKAFRLATQLATHERVHLTRKSKSQSFSNIDMEYPTHDIENNQQHQFADKLDSVGISIENSPSDDKINDYNSQSETCDDTVNRPFRCDLCDKSYIHHRSLINHRKTHQLGVFECTVCFKLFNNMAAFYSHQRTHKARSRTDLSLTGDTNTTLNQLPKHSHDASVNFCHLCQVLFPNEEEFQEHIQMHNSSSLSFGLQDTLSDKLNVSYDNNIASPESSFCTSPMNGIPSVSPVVNLRSFDHSQEQMASNGQGLLDFPSDQKPSPSSAQGEAPVLDTSIESPTQNVVETSAVESDERPFKCHICGKSYRHSGSLINHKRSHQVGIYRCSICSKTYPHLAALKSHLRLHKAQLSSFSLAAEGDWLSSEPLTLDNQHGCFSSPHEHEDAAHAVLGIDQESGVDPRHGAFYQEQVYQDFCQETTAHVPHKEQVVPRHMCADCGETFTDIAGIKCHSCPLLQQHTAGSEYSNNLNFQSSNGHCTLENPESNIEMDGLNGSQSYFEQNFHENANSAQLDAGRVDDPDEEEEEEEDDDDDDDDDGDHYQCSICGNSYSSMRALRSHLQGHTQSHDTPPSSGPSSLSSSEGVKEDEPGEMMICSTCGESFASRQDLTSHQLLHNKVQADHADHLPPSRGVSESKEEPQIICGSCGVFCESYDHLDGHGCTSEAKDESVRVKEEVNVNTVARREETSLSRGRVGGEDRRYKCDQCGRSYRHAGSLLNHKKSHKTGVFRCVICQKRFYNLLALKNHQRSHFDIKRHACNECGKAFKIQKQLLNHLRRHRENRAKIQELNNQIQALMQMNGTGSDGRAPPSASNAFARRRAQLPEGRAGHTKLETSVKLEGKRDQRPFACDQCGRTYRHAGSLVNHRNSHKTGEYRCSVCNNTYSNQLAMKNHLRTHFANKKHLCQNCGKGFRGNKQLLAHVCADLRKGGAGGRRGLRCRAFKCKKCKKAFISVDQLAAHTCDGPADCGESQSSTSPNKEERPFKCSLCSRTYRHAGSLLNHKNTHKTGHFSCTFCAKPFSNPMALRNHTRIHTQKKKYVCLTCGKAFRLASILHNHQRVHNRALSHFGCPSCGKRFQGRSGLKRHRCRRGQEGSTPSGVQQSERADKCFMCDLCGRSYRHAGSLLNHKKSHSENLHHCTLCLQTFPDAAALHAHAQMRRQCCPECGKTFCLVAHLQSHMETHSKQQAVVRAPRQQSFPTAASYQEHRGVCEPVEENLCWNSGVKQSTAQVQVPPPLAHIPESATDSQSPETSAAEEKSHVCDHCGRSYRHAGSLLNHKNSHKTGSFFCSVCQKEFTNLMALKNHRRIHTEPKRYQCLECGKAFRVSTQLICHRRIHTKEKPFACPLCDKSFSSKSNLRHHQKMHQSAAQIYDSSFSLDTDTFMDLDMESFL
ncbi:zinc finger protein 62 homolog isoform X2 [Kryptolebias marmoratus]|uniref:Zinc finger protein 646 n=2 Tax=Kryptolebias marmoratus TaxID=37003 RepID=A0A3Q3FU68_KRYMA|nr:zinc finger protein 62 homolog isoform X2 [Kryptolebias marmoratus]XP_017274023.1 zinc finger protein 62 homolog isoform X2 [Kryptolebias marmoratus]